MRLWTACNLTDDYSIGAISYISAYMLIVVGLLGLTMVSGSKSKVDASPQTILTERNVPGQAQSSLAAPATVRHAYG